MPEPRLIVFVGPVGSGKSTHIKLLYSKLKARASLDERIDYFQPLSSNFGFVFYIKKLTGFYAN